MEKLKILVYTITYNRLDLTKKYLGSLKEHTNIEFDHLIIDNGSTDGTQQWLKENKYIALEYPTNIGITMAQNKALMNIYKNYDLIIKYDNDCEVASDNILEHICQFYSNEGSENYVLSPTDLLLDKDYKPKSLLKEIVNGFDLELTTHNGGMFRVVPKKAMESIIGANIKMDCNEGEFWRKKRFKVGYFTNLFTIHRGLNFTSKNYIL